MKRPITTACLVSLFLQLPIAGFSSTPASYGNLFSFQSGSPSEDNQQAPLPLNSRLQIGGNYTWASISPHGFSSFRGNLGGAQGMYEYRPLDNFYGAAKLAWRQGETHGSPGKRSLVYVDAQERLGYTISFDDENGLVCFYTGLGYKYLGQNLKPKSGSSLKLSYNEIYIPVGGIFDYSFSNWFALGFGFTWMPQVYPTVTVAPLKGARWIIQDQLANFYVEMPFTFTLTKSKRFLLIIKPFYEYWRDGRTTAKTSNGVQLGIPGNTYNFAGVDVNFGFAF